VESGHIGLKNASLLEQAGRDIPSQKPQHIQVPIQAVHAVACLDQRQQDAPAAAAQFEDGVPFLGSKA
jgi:hypothetical protein